MSYLIRILVRDGRTRQSLLWLLLLSIVIALTGFISQPPLSNTSNQTAERFPCESCACGCPSAEHCWDRCCCHTDQEKLQWARENGVTPPQFLVDRVANACDTAPAKTSCCHCSHRDRNNAVSKTTKPTVATGSKTLIFWKAAECRGLTYIWSLLAAAYVSPMHRVILTEPLLIDRLGSFDETAISMRTPPEPPVP
ncbi:hypothetical protein [Rhodopirellula sp. MGV]|uniref:hypothetical protein n=1 Tax=Rhodopirellula sp. MGV TaxID=2023130 RepID=UPI000B9755D9|nr:hypothetical protein [Rhodopirellula sp. MGV]OYP38377.1 hypothetical protein CGZ80_02190 [Rhodopirellula sp. MGV]PNY34201.1 hypothetical protein C2E31_24640 [Rhodopirellula baltica]